MHVHIYPSSTKSSISRVDFISIMHTLIRHQSLLLCWNYRPYWHILHHYRTTHVCPYHALLTNKLQTRIQFCAIIMKINRLKLYSYSRNSFIVITISSYSYLGNAELIKNIDLLSILAGKNLRHILPPKQLIAVKLYTGI